jgi:hypothetical protein
MPSSYYQLSTTSLAFKGTLNGTTEVQLSDAFFNDPDAIKYTYVIPLVMISQTGFSNILTGKLMEGYTSAARTDASKWNVQPKDYVLYCVKYQNKYTGWWLTNHTTSIADIEKAAAVQIITKSLTQSIYTVGYGPHKADLLLSFDGNENCTITSLTEGVTVTGTGNWKDNGAYKAWGNKDRDLLELNYTLVFDDGYSTTTHEKLVWQRSGVTIEEFVPIFRQ